MADKINIMRNAYMKLDNMPLSFGIKAYSDDISDDAISKLFNIDLLDTIRELHIDWAGLESIASESYDEMMIENRVVYHAIKRFRKSASVFFKFSTAIDGKTVDKTNIPKMLTDILKEYDDEWSKYRGSNIGRLWHMEVDK